METRIVITEPDFDTGAEISLLHKASQKVGGICTFVGTVRDLNENDDVSGLFLEHYPGMTERQIGDIILRAAERWSILSATVIHRVGQLHPGDQIVFVGIGAAHRGEGEAQGGQARDGVAAVGHGGSGRRVEAVEACCALLDGALYAGRRPESRSGEQGLESRGGPGGAERSRLSPSSPRASGPR